MKSGFKKFKKSNKVVDNIFFINSLNRVEYIEKKKKTKTLSGIVSDKET